MKIQKIINIIVILVMLLINFSIYATNETDSSTNAAVSDQKKNINLDSFISSISKYTNDSIPDLDIKEMSNKLLKGEEVINPKGLAGSILKIFGKELQIALGLFVKLLAISIIIAFLTNLQTNMGQGNVSKIAYYACYTVMSILIATSFVDSIKLFRDTIVAMISFIQIVTPFLITLLITTGSITTASIVQPIMLFVIELIGFLITNIIIPLMFISLAFNIVSNLSDRVKIDGLAKIFSTAGLWIMGVVLTSFIALLSIQGGITSTVDGIGVKTAKTAVSTAIPVVGKFVGDAVDTVMGASLIIKDTVGAIGIIVIIVIAIVPVIKLGLVMGMYYITSAVIEPITNEGVKKCLKCVGDTYRNMMAILIATSVLFIISLGIIVNLANQAFMYR